MNKKLIWGVITVVVVILAICVYINYRGTYSSDPVEMEYYGKVPVQKTDDNHVTSVNTSNWKTYSNPKYGFSFKYPIEFIPSEVAATTKNELLRITFSSGSKQSFIISLIKRRDGEAPHPYVGTGKFAVLCGISDFSTCEINPGPQGNYLLAYTKDQGVQDTLEDILETYKEFTN